MATAWLVVWGRSSALGSWLGGWRGHKGHFILWLVWSCHLDLRQHIQHKRDWSEEPSSVPLSSHVKWSYCLSHCVVVGKGKLGQAWHVRNATINVSCDHQHHGVFTSVGIMHPRPFSSFLNDKQRMHMLAPEFLQTTCSMLNAVFSVYIITLQVNQLFSFSLTMVVSTWWPEFTEM